MRKLLAWTIVAFALASTAGCGTLVSPSTLVSMATSLFGGYANGAVMGGSVVGVIHDKATDGDAPPVDASAQPGRNPTVETSTASSLADSR